MSSYCNAYSKIPVQDGERVSEPDLRVCVCTLVLRLLQVIRQMEKRKVSNRTKDILCIGERDERVYVSNVCEVYACAGLIILADEFGWLLKPGRFTQDLGSERFSVVRLMSRIQFSLV